MIPLMPFSTLCRNAKFVTEEWNTYFGDGRVAQATDVQGGWRGILFANLAIINPVAAFNFFNQRNFDPNWLDGGSSRTWYLALTAGMSELITWTVVRACADEVYRSGRSTVRGDYKAVGGWCSMIYGEV